MGKSFRIVTSRLAMASLVVMAAACGKGKDKGSTAPTPPAPDSVPTPGASELTKKLRSVAFSAPGTDGKAGMTIVVATGEKTGDGFEQLESARFEGLLDLVNHEGELAVVDAAKTEYSVRVDCGDAQCREWTGIVRSPKLGESALAGSRHLSERVFATQGKDLALSRDFEKELNAFLKHFEVNDKNKALVRKVTAALETTQVTGGIGVFNLVQTTEFKAPFLKEPSGSAIEVLETVLSGKLDQDDAFMRVGTAKLVNGSFRTSSSGFLGRARFHKTGLDEKQSGVPTISIAIQEVGGGAAAAALVTATP